MFWLLPALGFPSLVPPVLLVSGGAFLPSASSVDSAARALICWPAGPLATSPSYEPLSQRKPQVPSARQLFTQPCVEVRSTRMMSARRKGATIAAVA